jgi:hypothetical protein
MTRVWYKKPGIEIDIVIAPAGAEIVVTEIVVADDR